LYSRWSQAHATQGCCRWTQPAGSHSTVQTCSLLYSPNP
jgi:hypothetical protein